MGRPATGCNQLFLGGCFKKVVEERGDVSLLDFEAMVEAGRMTRSKP